MPAAIHVFRHLESAQTLMRRIKSGDPVYVEFLDSFQRDPYSTTSVELAHKVNERFPARTSNDDTPLADGETEHGNRIGAALRARYLAGLIALPDRIVTSGVLRTNDTAAAIIGGFPELADAITQHPGMLVEDPRVKERSIGDAEQYSDTSVYLTLHPDILRARRAFGDRERFDFRYPGGENIPDVIERANAWDAARPTDENLWVFSHQMFSLVYRILHEQTSEGDIAQRYVYLSSHEIPPTGSMTMYEQSYAGHVLLKQSYEVLA